MFATIAASIIPLAPVLLAGVLFIGAIVLVMKAIHNAAKSGALAAEEQRSKAARI